MDLEKLSDDELRAVADGNLDALSDDALRALAGEEENISQLGALGSSALQGLTLGFADELAGVFSDDAKSAMREYQQQAYDQYPGTALLGDIGGALLPAVAAAPFTAGGSLTALPASLGRSAAVQAAKRVIPKTVAGKAAAYGGIAGVGYGDSEGVIDTTADLAKGAAGGYAFGKALPLIGRGLQAGAQKVVESLPRERNVESLAQRKILEALSRDKFTPETAMQRIRELGPEATFADIGPNMMGLTRAATAQPGEARTLAERLFQTRSRNARNRLNEAMQRAFGKTDDFYGEMRSLERQMKADAGPLYREAYSAQLPMTGKLKDLLNRDVIKNAYRSARTIADAEGVKLPQILRVVDGRPQFIEVPDMRTWDYIKGGLDDLIEGAQGDFGKNTRKSRAYSIAKRELVDELDQLNPAYKEARMAYAGPASNKSAMEQGRKFIKDDAELTAERIAGMSDSEREYFRAGAMRAMRDKILENSNPRLTLEKLERTGKMETVFPDEEAYQAFRSAIEREAKFQDTSNKILGGSPTARIEAEKLDLGVDPGVMADVISARPLAATTGLVRNILNRAQLPSERIREQIGPMLLSQDAAMQQQVLQGLIPEASAGLPISPYAFGNVGGLLGTAGGQ